MKVGEVARRSGVNVETLRYYERRGLLPPPDREPSGHRRYDEDTVRFLRAIKEAQAVGFTLTEIGEYLRAARRSERPSETLRIRMASKIDEIDNRIAGLRRMRDELARVVGCACDSLDHCTCGAAYLARRGREPATRPTLLHVTNGESAGNTLRATVARRSGAALAGRPPRGARAGGAAPELLDVRAAFLSGCGWGRRSAIRSSLERRDRQLPRRSATASSVVLWFEHDLYDQLQLIDALALADEAGAPPELIVVSLVPGQAVVPRARRAERGRARDALAEPAPGDLRDARRGCEAWDAFRAPEPDGARGVRGATSGRSSCSAPRCCVCSRSCPLRVTASPERSAERSRRSRRARPPRRPPSRGAGARGGAVPRRRLVLPGARRARRRATSGSWKARTVARCRRRLRSATAAASARFASG